MDMNKEKEAFEGVFPCSVGTTLNEYGHYESKINQQDAMIQNISWVVWQAAKNHANKQFESFLNQAIEDSACADERRSLQVLLEDFQDNLEADKRKGQKRVAVNLEDL